MTNALQIATSRLTNLAMNSKTPEAVSEDIMLVLQAQRDTMYALRQMLDMAGGPDGTNTSSVNAMKARADAVAAIALFESV